MSAKSLALVVLSLSSLYLLIIKDLNQVVKISKANIYNLMINHLKSPLGIDIKDNSFSFLSDDCGPFKVSLYLNSKKIQSKKVTIEESHSFTFKTPLKYGKQYRYVVEGTNSSNYLDFETAIKLEAPLIKPVNTNLFSPIFTKQFNIKKEISRARLYITGLGLYQAYINNKKVGNAYLTPGYNDYDYYLRYQTYDVTNLLSNDNNIIEVHMGDGWYKGRFGLNIIEQYNIYGSEYKLCAHLLIEYKDKTIDNILTDTTWKVKRSKERANSIYDGEEIDYTINDDSLQDVVISEEKYNLIPDYGALIVEKKILHPELYISPKGEQILDFRQNMVGFIRYKGYLEKNQVLKIKHGEILQDGCFFNLNLKSAKALLKFRGDGKQRIFEPKFTYFGFRYALVQGLDKVVPEDFEGVVIHTNLETTIKCNTDNKKINKLIQNSFWGQRGNFLDVPTDCPQRDERLGWTGDTQVFSNTACYNMDSYIFYKKYMKDIRGDQIMYYSGGIPAYSPSIKSTAREGGAVWADVGTILPWNIYMNYGDKELLKENYMMMKDYVEFLIQKDKEQGNSHLILEGFTYGDWLALDGEDPHSRLGGTDSGYIMSVYYYNSVRLISLAAKELDLINDEKKYDELKTKIYNAILKKYFSSEGKLNLNTQTSYILSLHYGIYKNKKLILDDFKQRLEKDSYHIKTGFTGTPLILLTLFDNGLDEIAYRILYNEEYPGWLYAINLGATTIWERWNSLLENGKISDLYMNSFNHYAYGSVCESIYSRIAGLQNMAPGWRKVRIEPHLNYRMKTLNFAYDSISGRYEIVWELVGNKFFFNVTIPYGCTAQIFLPDGSSQYVHSGKYYTWVYVDKKIYLPFNLDTPIVYFIKNEQIMFAMKNKIPNIFSAIQNKGNDFISKNSINDINALIDEKYSTKIMNRFAKELNSIKV